MVKKMKLAKKKTGKTRKLKTKPRASRSLCVSAHHYLDPFCSTGHVVSSKPHAPYLVVDSVARWTQSVAANTDLLLQLCFTNTNCRGFYGGWTHGVDATCLPIILPQLSTLSPTHVCPQRLGVSLCNVTNSLKRAGNVYILSTNDVLNVNFDTDNTGDVYMRLTDAVAGGIVSRITGSLRTRTVPASATINTPVKCITTLTNGDFDWQGYLYADPTSNGSNLIYEASISAADAYNLTSSVLIYIPGQADAQSYQITVRSQDGCRFDTDHALYASSRHAPVIPSHLVGLLHTTAHIASHQGETAPVIAAPHETFMQRVSGFIHGVGEVAESVARSVPRIGAAIYNSARTAQILNGLRAGGATIEAGAEMGAPLLLAA